MTTDYPYRVGVGFEKGHGVLTFNRFSKTYEDGYSSVRGIESTATRTRDGAWAPRWNDYKRLRELNGLPAITTAKVSAVLKKAGFTIAKYIRSGRVKGWGEWSRGFKVEYDEFGRIVVKHKRSHWGKREQDLLELATYRIELEKAGLTVNELENGDLWI